MSAPVEVLISELQCRILVEVYLAHGPVDIFRLWSEMFERQKSISSGLLSFTRAIVQLEDEGYLQKVAEMNSTLAPKGEMYLIGAVLSGELPEGCWEKLSSTQNILDESARGDAAPYRGLSSPAVTRDCPNRGRDLSAISSTAILDVAGQASGNAPLTDGFQVGDEGVGGEKADSRRNGQLCEIHSPADSQFQGTTIEALVDAVFRAEEHAAEIERVQQ